MFYAIQAGKIDLANFEFEIAAAEIEKLNQLAIESIEDPAKKTEIIAISFHAYAYLSEHYQILRSGASMGSRDYGPRLISHEAGLLKSNKEKIKIAVPGKYTSAWLCLQIYAAENGLLDRIEPYFCSFSEVFELLAANKVDASLLIHESQLRYKEEGYSLELDLGNWWDSYSNGLAMPLGCNVVARDLAQKELLAKKLKESIEWGLANFEETLDYARKFAKNKLDDDAAKEYINMYVNEKTVALADDDIRSIELMLKSAQQLGLIEQKDLKIDALN